MADTVGNLNPFRYRGYYYDIETGFYYLNSRYYDPVVGRFVNADNIDVLSEEQNSMVQYNLFSYCLNNPVKMVDKEGNMAGAAVLGAMTGAAAVGGANSWNPVGWFILGTVAVVATGIALGVGAAKLESAIKKAKSKRGTGRPQLKKQGREDNEKKKQKPGYKKRSGKTPREQPRPHHPSNKGHKKY